MPWAKIIEVGTASGLVGGAVLWIGSKLYLTKKEKKNMEDACSSYRQTCQVKLCAKIDKVAIQIETNKLEMIAHRDRTEEKLSTKVEGNRKIVSEHYSEVKHALGVIQGQLGVIERMVNGNTK